MTAIKHEPNIMRRILPAFIALLPAAAMALSPSDVLGPYEWEYTDFTTGARKAVSVEIAEAGTPGRVAVKGLYLDSQVLATVDYEASTIALDKTDLPEIMEGAGIHHMSFANGAKKALYTPLVGSIASNGITFPEGEGIGVGIPSMNAWFTLAADCRFGKDLNRDFVFVPEEWTVMGTASLTDAWLTYHYTNEFEREPYDVAVARNNDNPHRICLIDPFPNDIWGEWNADPEGKGHIVIDLTNPECVKLEPRVYSGFTDPQYGKLMMYNYEGNFSRYEAMDDEAILERLARQGGIAGSHLEEELLVITGPIFATDRYPTAIYGWQEQAAYVELPAEILDFSGAKGLEAVPEGEETYHDLQGRPLTAPGKGVTIVRKGGTARKVLR